MPSVEVAYGEGRIRLDLPDGVAVTHVGGEPPPPAADGLGVVASALDQPLGSAPVEERARDARHVTIVVPDATRPSPTEQLLLPLLARLARAGLGPDRIRLLVARGIHPVLGRDAVTRLVGREVMEALRPVQSTPETPSMNETLFEDETLGAVRVHRLAAEADLLVLTGPVVPHHLAGFGGGAKALVPGVAERDTVLAAHRLTLGTLVRPDGRVRSLAGQLGPNRFRERLLDVARRHGRCFLLNVVLGEGGAIAAARAGEVGEAHEAACRDWQTLHDHMEPEPHDLVVVGAAAPRDHDLIQAHKRLLEASAWAREGAPIVWLARAPAGPGHPRLLPWFEIRRPEEHLAALRRTFHPYGLTAYSLRQLARRHPVHVVSEVDGDILRPMGLMPFADAPAALRHALREHDVARVAVLPT